MDFLDEAAGVASVGLPDLQADFGVSYAVAVLVVFTVPGVVATVCEPPLLLFADHRPRLRKPLVIGGLVTMGAAMLVAAAAPGPVTFAFATSVAWVGNGLGVNLAQATLMDADPDRRESSMARWVLMGTLGDLAAPALLAGLAWAGFGWRAAMAVVAVAFLAYAPVLATRAFPLHTDEDGARAGLFEALQSALANRELLLWLGAAALCGLLDEVFVAFGSAWLQHAHGAGLGVRGLVFTIGTSGGVVGLMVLQRVLASGVDPVRWLAAVSTASAVALVAWIAAPNLVCSTVALFVLEALVAQLYPLAQAQAYRALPERSAMVEALAGLFGPLDLAAPLVVGLVADRFGLVPALLLLGMQPIGIAMLALTRQQR